MRRAKIVATIGPAIESPEKISEAIKAGLNVARLNMSHGDHAEHQARYNTIREESAKLGKDVAILADLQGPKIRLERFANGKDTLSPAQTSPSPPKTLKVPQKSVAPPTRACPAT